MRITFDPLKRQRTLRERGLDMRRAREVFAGIHFTRADDRDDYGELRTAMSVKRNYAGRTSRRSNEAPEITETWVAEADLHRGEKLIRRGRPKLENPKRLLSLRLAPEVIASWKATGPGWQTRMAEVLTRSRPRSRKYPG